MLIGYARVSTVDQEAGLEAQIRDLEAAGCEKVFSERVSSIGDRDQLNAAIDYLREGDKLAVTKLDRLARSVADLVKITERIKAKGAALNVLGLNLDTATPTGALLLNMLGSIAQFEREIMLERQREGIIKAKAAGKFGGRKPIPPEKVAEAIRMAQETGNVSRTAEAVGISRASVQRALKAAQTTEAQQ